jgi:hypothetical protein
VNEFYVGYLPKAPSGIARRIRGVVVLLLAFAAAFAVVFAKVQRTYAPSAFEFGKVRNFEGVIEKSPYPSLAVSRPGATEAGPSLYLLVATGKHGADSQVAAYIGKTVRLRGTLIYRSNQTMIELVSDSISVLGVARQPSSLAKDLGISELTGEIVDSKCYLGVMNPGNGKVHRDCAVRCLSGGIPPIFASNDFNGIPAIFLLTGPNRKPLPKETFLVWVARPVRIRGRIMQSGDTMSLETEPSAISPLP